jgi:hypothetical protein
MPKYPISGDDFLWSAINLNDPMHVIISTMNAFCGNANGTEIIDQTIFSSSMINILYESCKLNYINVVGWICANFVPIDVSYDNNACYNIAASNEIKVILSKHHSFNLCQNTN